MKKRNMKRNQQLSIDTVIELDLFVFLCFFSFYSFSHETVAVGDEKQNEAKVYENKEEN